MISMHFLTIHPELIRAYQQFGVFKAAQTKNLAAIEAIDLRQFAGNHYGSVDDRPYGGGDSMIMRPDPLAQAIQSLPQAPYVVLTSPGGTPWRHHFAMSLAKVDRPIVFVCARFGGVDQRFVDKYVHAEYSVGDFVVSGGELPCLLIADSVLRQIPGALGNDDSAIWDSFTDQNGGQLEHPVYTRPQVFEGAKVPAELVSGDHAKIAKWKSSEALRRTILNRPDLLQRH